MGKIRLTEIFKKGRDGCIYPVRLYPIGWKGNRCVMKKLSFRYYMRLTFSEPVREHRFTLKCLPKTTGMQRVEGMEVDVFPNRFIERGEDSFGNLSIYGYTKEEHDRFYFDVRGRALTGIMDGEADPDSQKAGMFKYQTTLTKPGDGLLEYQRTLKKDYDKWAQSHAGEGRGDIQRAVYIMESLNRDFGYAKGVTGITTTAEEAWKHREGVCQDYAHIMLALCRMEKIPCRYVTGMLAGEGMSHAWTEAYAEGKWIALDPTNGIRVTDQHIRISVGRDYQDCIINQGIFIGNAEQIQEVSVSVREDENEEGCESNSQCPAPGG